MSQSHVASASRCESIPESTNTAQTIERKSPTRSLTPQVAEQCAYRWLYAGQSTRQISNGLRIHDRPLVESAIRERLRSGPLTAPGLRGAA